MKKYIKSAITPISSESPDSQALIARDPNTPVEILEQLSASKNLQVQSAIASNPNTPETVLRKYANKCLKNVAVAEPILYGSLAHNPNLPQDLMEKFATNTDFWFRVYVASNPNLPMELLKKLANDSKTEVRQAVLRNPNVPPVLYKLLADALSFWIDVSFEIIFEDSENDSVALNSAKRKQIEKIIKRILKGYKSKLNFLDYGMSEQGWDVADEYYENGGIIVEQLTINCTFIPEDYMCDEICGLLKDELGKININVLDTSYMYETR